MHRGVFITFEGIDGSGKSTHLRLLASELRLRGYNLVTTREPGGTPLGARLRDLLLRGEEQVDPLAELLLYAADRAQHVRTLVRPALETGHIVLSDRYADATVAYQGAGRGFPSDLIADIVRIGTDGLMPDLTLVFDVSVAVAHARMRKRNGIEKEEDRFEREEVEFHTRVRDAYRQLAAQEPTRVRLIDASGSIEETHARVIEIVLPFLEENAAGEKAARSV
ncbi:dTMP kinase [Pyrinomonas methylaliphatogenes]|jgi:dTMP kinase|uniref:Thymidylate kinase n=1 Tax=Pyrinomonas methylaliphatogenes TaxID=454194 RepID=A0A0B6WZD3_9BACT|nr:dTMP kinase [Pyrinomonas methylaliphatogenes]CDM65535.1 thymidylate kinase [Pyrinomonas methylaliphatogenes]